MNLHIYQQSDHGDSLDRNFRRLFLDKNITWSSREDNPTCNQSYTYRVLQTIQMKLILLCVLAEGAVLGSAKTALKLKYEI